MSSCLTALHSPAQVKRQSWGFWWRCEWRGCAQRRPRAAFIWLRQGLAETCTDPRCQRLAGVLALGRVKSKKKRGIIMEHKSLQAFDCHGVAGFGREGESEVVVGW